MKDSDARIMDLNMALSIQSLKKSQTSSSFCWPLPCTYKTVPKYVSFVSELGPLPCTYTTVTKYVSWAPTK